MASHEERILILAKTYPSPSAKYVETSCVAGINEQGVIRRLYPVPFRLIEESQQFKKWQWVNVRVEKSNNDHRKESHKVFIDTIRCLGSIDTKDQWVKRWEWIDKIPSFGNFNDLDREQKSSGLSLALLRPKQIIKLDIVESKNKKWTDEELEKLMLAETQISLFESDDKPIPPKTLEKIPFDFYYYYLCDGIDGEEVFKHKLVDWEVGALYRKCLRAYGNNWQEKFREKLEGQLLQKDTMFMMGNLHRFQEQWLIISLIYPPKRMLADDLNQASLF